MTGEPGTIGTGAESRGAALSGTAESSPDSLIAEEIARKSRWNRRVALIGGLVVLIAAAVVLPPLVNIGRYQRTVTALMSRSMGRPVSMSSVELRLLPRPGFVLNDLSVSEDPAFGAEPILSARTVVASIRILSLWRGRLEIDRVSVDEASLNLVRSAQGRWNLDSLLMGARPALTGADANGLPGQGRRASGASAHFPYLSATDSRINLKNGVEKSPYSLVAADLSLWQDEPGAWRVRLRGQPVRTDMEMSSADTGEVRVEASLHTAAQLREMPLQLQMEWREAQLGQLSRLLFGSDAGWRGDLTADIAVQGTADNAQTKARLRATGVRRQEFAPETPLDFDANCNFLFQRAKTAFHNLDCDTAIGNGRLHLKGDLPGTGGKPEAMLEVSQIPIQAGLDLLRTVRSGFAPGISAKGTVNGSLTYKEMAADDQAAKKPLHRPAVSRSAQNRSAQNKSAQKLTAAESASLPANLHGTLTVEGAQLKGDGLKEPLTLPKMTLAPALPASAPGHTGSISGVELASKFTVVLAPPAASQAAVSPTTAPASPAQATAAAAPSDPAAESTNAKPPVTQTPTAQASTAQTPTAQAITVRLGVGARGYNAALTGSVAPGRLRELAYAFGLPHLDAADGFAGGVADLNLAAAGPWIASSGSATAAPLASAAGAAPAAASTAAQKTASGAPGSASATNPAPAAAVEALPGQDSLSGSATLHHTQWKAAYLGRPVDLAQATITVSAGKITFASDFSYGQKSAGKDATKEKDVAKDIAREPVRAAITGSVAVNTAIDCKPGAPGGPAESSGPTESPAKTDPCQPQVELRFGALDAASVESALTGVPAQKSLFSPLIDRMRSSDRPKWPEVAVRVQAESLLLGTAMLQKPVLHLQLKPSEIVFEGWEADLLGGSAKGTGRFAWVDTGPEYNFEGSFSRIQATAIGELLNTQWAGGPVSGTGKIKLTGLSSKELAASAAGDLQFDWIHGALLAAASQEAHPQEAHPQEARAEEARFDDWNGAVAIQGGKAQIGQNAMLLGKRISIVAGTIPFGGPVKLTVGSPETRLASHSGPPVSPPAVK